MEVATRPPVRPLGALHLIFSMSSLAPESQAQRPLNARDLLAGNLSQTSSATPTRSNTPSEPSRPASQKSNESRTRKKTSLFDRSHARDGVSEWKGYTRSTGFDTMPDAEDTWSGNSSFTLQVRSAEPATRGADRADPF